MTSPKKIKREAITRGLSFIMAIFFTIACIAVTAIAVVKSVRFEMNCGDYIRLAAKANTVELAMENLSVAIKYAEENDLTEGNTSLFINLPRNDIGFWYSNMKTAYQGLVSISEGSTVLEKSNALMKIETLAGEMPELISFYPNQGILIWFAITFVAMWVLWFIYGSDD